MLRPCDPFCRKHGRYWVVKRRECITLLGGAAAGWLLAARAQQGSGSPLIGDHPIFATGGL